MKKVFVLPLFIFLALQFSSTIVYSQCDSLATASQNSKGTEKVDALNEFARCFFGSDFEKMDSLSTLALNLATNINYLSGTARAKQNKGLFLYYFKGEREVALSNYYEALSLYRQAGDSIGVAKAMIDIGGYYHYNQEVGLALNLYIEALQICEDEEYPRGISAVSNNIGTIYSITKEWDKALIYFKKAWVLCDSIIDPKNYAIQTANITTAFVFLKERDSAEYYFNLGVNFTKKLNDPGQISSMYLNMTGLYKDAENVSHPDWRYLQAYTDSAYFYAKNTKRWETKVQATYEKGILTKKQGNNDLAKKYFLEIIAEFSEDYAPNISFVGANVELGKIYATSGSFKQAYNFLLTGYDQKLKLDKALNIELLEEMGIKYQVDQSKKELELIKIDKDLTELKLVNSETENEKKDILAKKKQIQIYAIAVGLLLSLFAGFMAFRGYRNKLKSNKIILEQKKEVEKQKDEIEEQHREIKDSIAYAKRIQSAILPSDKLVSSYLKDSFILYKPKDVVAGDFYWMEPLEKGLLFAAADCTGHGVPGAMVSVVCNNALNRSVREFGLTNPAEILDKTREIVIQEFEKSEEEVKDGMDIAICLLDGNMLHYAGAYNPLWIIRKGTEEVEEIKASKQPIGKFSNQSPFTNNVVELSKGDTFYIFSDGFADQFGGSKAKKFKTANFKKLLVSIQNQDIDSHKASIDKVFEDWKDGLEQVDDVCVIGVRI